MRNFSIVIPTKDKLQYLKKTLSTVLNQDYNNYEIVISDCSETDETFNYFKDEINLDKVKYFRANKNFTRSENWENGLNQCKNEFITVLGDDDGYFPNSLSTINQLMEKFNCDIINWSKLNYSWPDHNEKLRQNVLNGYSYPVVEEVISEKKFKLFLKFLERYTALPCIYNSIVHIKYIDKIKSLSKNKTFFSGVIPDVYSGIVLSRVAHKYLQTFFPLSINAASRLSGGYLQSKRNLEKKEEFYNQIKDLNIETLSKSYDAVIGKSTAVYSIELGEYLLAKKNLTTINWPEPKWKKYLKALERELNTSQNKEEIKNSILHTANAKKINYKISNIKNFDEKIVKGTSYRLEADLPLGIKKISDVEEFSHILNHIPPIDKIEKNSLKFFINQWIDETKKLFLRLMRIYFSK